MQKRIKRPVSDANRPSSLRAVGVFSPKRSRESHSRPVKAQRRRGRTPPAPCPPLCRMALRLSPTASPVSPLYPRPRQAQRRRAEVPIRRHTCLCAGWRLALSGLRGGSRKPPILSARQAQRRRTGHLRHSTCLCAGWRLRLYPAYGILRKRLYQWARQAQRRRAMTQALEPLLCRAAAHALPVLGGRGDLPLIDPLSD